jgi:hypothetical protein
MKINLNYNIKKARVYTKLALSSKKQNLSQGIAFIAISLGFHFSVYKSILNHNHIYTVSSADKDALIIGFGFLIIGVVLVLKSFTNK